MAAKTRETPFANAEPETQEENRRGGKDMDPEILLRTQAVNDPAGRPV